MCFQSAKQEALRKQLEEQLRPGLDSIKDLTKSLIAKKASDSHTETVTNANKQQEDLENETARNDAIIRKKREEMTKRKAVELAKSQEEYQKHLTLLTANADVDFGAKEKEREERQRQVNKRLQEVGVRLMKAGKIHQQKRFFAINQLVYKITKVQRMSTSPCPFFFLKPLCHVVA